MNTKLAGLIGLGLSACLWLLSSWRLAFHTMVTRRRANSYGDYSDRSLFVFRITCRRTFHMLLWIATAGESIAYAKLSGLLPLCKSHVFGERLEYVLLEVVGRSVMELLAFSVVTVLWVRIAIQASPETLMNIDRQNIGQKILPALYVSSCLILVFVSGLLAVVILAFTPFDKGLNEIRQSIICHSHAFLEAIAWGLHASLVVQCVWITAKRIMSLSTFPHGEWRKGLVLLSKALLPMVMVSLCYLLRCIWLCYFLFGNNEQNKKIGRYSLTWWIGFEWSPTFVVIMALLYSARKRDHLQPSMGNTSNLNMPLMGPTEPSAEPFVSFRRMLDRFDDSFCFSSAPTIPFLTVTSNPTTEVADEETLSDSCIEDTIARNSSGVV